MKSYGFNEKNFADWSGFEVKQYVDEDSMSVNVAYFDRNSDSFRIKISSSVPNLITALVNDVYINDVVSVSSCMKIVTSSNCKIENYVLQSYWDTESITREYTEDYVQTYDYEPIEYTESMTRFACNNIKAGLRFMPATDGNYDIYIILKNVTVTINECSGRMNTEIFGSKPSRDLYDLNKKIIKDVSAKNYSGLYKTTNVTSGERPSEYSVVNVIPYTSSIIWKQYFTPVNSVYGSNSIFEADGKYKPLSCFNAPDSVITQNLTKWHNGTICRNSSNGSLNVVVDGIAKKYSEVLCGTTSERPPSSRFVGQQFFDTTLDSLVIWNGSAWIVQKNSTSAFVALDTPYYTYKMQQEGIYEDYVAYRDELHEYEQAQKQAVEGVAMMNELVEPQPSQALLDFKEKYLG